MLKGILYYEVFERDNIYEMTQFLACYRVFWMIFDIKLVISKTSEGWISSFFVVRKLENSKLNGVSFSFSKLIIIIRWFLRVCDISNKLPIVAHKNLTFSVILVINKLSHLNCLLLTVVKSHKLFLTFIWNSNCILIIQMIKELNWVIRKLKLRIACAIHKRN